MKLCKKWFSPTMVQQHCEEKGNFILRKQCCVWDGIGKVAFTLKSLLTTKQPMEIFTFNECGYYEKSNLIAIMTSFCNTCKLCSTLYNQCDKTNHPNIYFGNLLLHLPYSLDLTLSDLRPIVLQNYTRHFEKY